MKPVELNTKSSLIILLVGLMTAGAFFLPEAKSDSTLFFDDFTGPSMNSPWNWTNTNSIVDRTRLSQSNGYLVSTIRSTGETGISQVHLGAETTNPNPIVDSNTPEGTIIVLTAKIQVSNLTTSIRPTYYTMRFGIGTPSSYQTNNQISFFITVGIGQAGKPYIDDNIWTVFNRPNPNAAVCFGWSPCGTNYGGDFGIHYNNQRNPMNLRDRHVFQIAMKFNPDSDNSWAAFSIDNMAYLNVTNQACSCIDGSGGYASLYPFFRFVNEGAVLFYDNSQASSGSLLDYLLITDFIPNTSPTGQSLPTGQIGPVRQGPYSNLFKTAAASMGGGNLYLGGFWLTLIMIVAMILPTARLFPNPFLMQFGVVGILGINTFLGILPVWVIFIAGILIAAIALEVVTFGRGEKVEMKE